MNRNLGNPLQETKSRCDHEPFRHVTLSQFMCCRYCGVLMQRNRFGSLIRNHRSSQLNTDSLVAFDPLLLLRNLMIKDKAIVPELKNPCYLKDRKKLLSVIQSVTKMMNLNDATFFASIKIMDRIFSKIDFEQSEQKLIVLLCIRLASKIEECDEGVLSSGAIFTMTKEKFSIEKIHEGEQILFGLLKNSSMTVSVLDFLKLLLVIGVVDDNDLSGLYNINHERFVQDLESQIKKLSVYFLSISKCNFEKSGLVAAVIIYMTRKAFNLYPWPIFLESILGFSEQTVIECTNSTLDVFKVLVWKSLEASYEESRRNWQLSSVTTEKVDESFSTCVDSNSDGSPRSTVCFNMPSMEKVQERAK